jgi:hypothetical protein
MKQASCGMPSSPTQLWMNLYVAIFSFFFRLFSSVLECGMLSSTRGSRALYSSISGYPRRKVLHSSVTGSASSSALFSSSDIHCSKPGIRRRRICSCRHRWNSEVSLSARLLSTLSLASTGPPFTGVEGYGGSGWPPNSVDVDVAWVLCVSRALLCE